MARYRSYNLTLFVVQPLLSLLGQGIGGLLFDIIGGIAKIAAILCGLSKLNAGLC